MFHESSLNKTDNQLPEAMELLDEIWRLIFSDYLELVDTFRCRQVSKRFKFLVDQLRPSGLFVCGHEPWKYSPYVGGYRDDQKPAQWIQLIEFNLRPRSSFQIVLANLKCLEINIYLKADFNLELFNEFTRLEKLYLNQVMISKSQTLRLPKLKVFSVNLFSGRENVFLVLESKVRRLFCGQPTLPAIKHPECVEYFEWPKKFLNIKKLAIPTLKNLRILHAPISEAMLESFPVLEELYLDDRVSDEQVKRLMDKKASLQSDVKVYFMGVLLPIKFRWLRIPRNGGIREDHLWYLRLINYHRLADRVDDLRRINHGTLKDCLDHCLHYLESNHIELNEWQFPVSFFQRFPNIKNIYVDYYFKHYDFSENDRFVWFLSQCNGLIELDLNSADPDYIESILMACKQLKKLVLSHFEGVFSSSIFRSICGLKQLFKLELSSQRRHLVSHRDLAALFGQCRYLIKVRLENVVKIEVKKGLYHVCTSEYCEPTICQGEEHEDYHWRPFKYEGLQLNLEAIIAESWAYEIKTNDHWKDW